MKPLRERCSCCGGAATVTLFISTAPLVLTCDECLEPCCRDCCTQDDGDVECSLCAQSKAVRS